MRILLLALLALLTLPALAQPTFPYNGVADSREGLYAFTNATIYVAWNKKLDGATLLIRKGRVEAVGQQVAIPAGAVVIDLTGKTIYPSFIDLYASYGMPETKGPEGPADFSGRRPQDLTSKKGAYAWNEALKPEFQAHEVFAANDKAADEYRKLGFGALLTHHMDGISRGTSALVALSRNREHESILLARAAHHLSFRKGASRQDYPSSFVGAVALLRQTYLDARWYAANGAKEETNFSLEAWNQLGALPQIFETSGKIESLKALQIGQEFGISYIIKGGGDEYQWLPEFQKAGAAFILSLNFPEAYDVEDPYQALNVSLTDLKHWEMAPAQPARLAQAGMTFALTAHGLKNKTEFWDRLRKAILHGLPEDKALQSLTETPARLAGASQLLGALDPGKVANFIVTNGNVFEKTTRIEQNWIQGQPWLYADPLQPDLSGAYDLQVGANRYSLTLTPEKTTLRAASDTTDIKGSHQYDNGLLTLSFPSGKDGAIRLSGYASGKNWSGRGQIPDGQWISWSATYQGAAPEEAKRPEKTNAAPTLGEVWYPFTAFGQPTPPKAEKILFRNATVWTNEKEGILQNADVLVENGRIAKVGQNLRAADARVVDATGKHLTAGIIDEHSHIALYRGVNEGTQASSAEVRMTDAVDPEDINIYRQLSGGVTTSQLLHGSANPIGGQSAFIKLRWGTTPSGMLFQGADPFIKFALGENVKQANWGENFRSRFPQTRMGVEQVFENYFNEARAYGQLKASGKPYRTDLELEALLEILQGKRFITCHSYQQSEINMLMHLADRFGFRVNTFTHILEGYKVADNMKEHGAGGSSFSDWWAYKYEVYEAIPYNGALMHEQGVLVAFNSDDAEMARRLNQEAAKAVLYGGVSEEEALKFVTLNPAKLLHIDDRVGSIREGKDADIVLWSGHPLSVYTLAEMTLVDGIPYFDRERDRQLQTQLEAERARLIQKMLDEKKQGGKTRPVPLKDKHLYHCDDWQDELRGE